MEMVKPLLFFVPIFLYSDPSILWFQDYGGTGEELMVILYSHVMMVDFYKWGRHTIIQIVAQRY